jgi:hypothetical protein
MAWSKRTNEALKAWLSPITAHTNHPIDDARFYDFIAFVWIDEKRIWDEGLALDNLKRIAQELHPSWPLETIEELVHDRLSEGSKILAFLSNAREKELLSQF